MAAQGQERAPGRTDLGRVRGRRTAADRADQSSRPGRCRPSARTTASRCRSSGSGTRTRRPPTPADGGRGQVSATAQATPSEHRRSASDRGAERGRRQAMTAALPSYSSGTVDGSAARRHDRGQPRPDGGAGGRRTRRWSSAAPGGAGAIPSSSPRSTPARWGSTPSASRRATGSASGRPTAPSGSSSSTGRRSSARSWSTSTRPTAPTSWATCWSRPASRCWSRRRRSRPATTGRWSPRSRGECTDLREVVFLGDPEWERLMATGRAGDRALLAAAGDRAVGRRPDQHPVHVGDDGLPEGRDAHPPQPAQQRLLRRRGLRLHRGRPGLHPGALLPLLRHGDGQPRRPPRTARPW